MILAVAFLLAAQEAAPAPPPVPPTPPTTKDTCYGHVAGSFLQVAIDVPGFTTEQRQAAILRQTFGNRAVLIGAIPEQLTSIELIADKAEDPAMTDAKWRDDNLEGSGARWNQFVAAGLECGEISVMMDGSGSHDYHAFFVRAGYRFDLHVGESITEEKKQAITREAFVKIVGSLRLAIVRRGTWEQMPPAAIEAMDQAIRRRAGGKAWLAERMEATPGEYALPFAAAELARHEGAPPAEQLPLYSRAIERLEAKRAALKPEESLSAPDALALAASEDGLGLALLESGEAEKALPHLEHALEIAHDLTAPTRAGVKYDLACAHARLGQEEKAIARLVESESELPGAFVRARVDKEFDPIRQSKRFQDLLSGDRGNR